jgi:hypothetical protein
MDGPPGPWEATLLVKKLVEEKSTMFTGGFHDQRKQNGLDPGDIDFALAKGTVFNASTGNYIDSTMPAYELQARLEIEGAAHWVYLEFYFYGKEKHIACFFGCRTEKW